MKKIDFINKVFKTESQIVTEGRILRVFDFDDTLAKSDAFIYVKHKDGSESKLDPAEYAKYNSKTTDVFDFRDFNKMLNNTNANYGNQTPGST